jgi:hypothetical protein
MDGGKYYKVMPYLMEYLCVVEGGKDGKVFNHN